MTNSGVFLELDLNQVSGFPADFYYEYASEFFIEEVSELQLPAGVFGPIQKGKEFSAEFVKLSHHGVTLHLKVISENKRRKFEGEVAFFLPSTYNKRIIYKTFFDGESLITIEADKAFVAHAYTSDGTVLRLVLNTVKNFPDSFYIKVETDEPYPPIPSLPYITPKNIKTWSNAADNFTTPIDNYFEIKNGKEQTNSISRYCDTTTTIQHLLKEAIKREKAVKAAGSGWSYSKIAATEGWVLDVRELSMCFTVTKSNVVSTYKNPEQLFFAQCGCTIAYINNILKNNGQSLKTTSASTGQTIAGAISTGSHGSAIDFGSMQDL